MLTEEYKDRADALRRIALLVEYDGARYSGFQWQPDSPTVQSELELAIEKLTGERVRVAGAGRTDSGVHARGQVAAFLTSSAFPPETLLQAMNHHLPHDISVQLASEVDLDFDPRRDALSRRYRYAIYNAPTPSPLLRGRSCHVRGELNISAMERAAGLLVGAHDFASFTRSPEIAGASTVRQVTEVSLYREGRLLILEMEGNAFLTHQVRRTAGALVEVGRDRMTIDAFTGLIHSPTPGLAGPTLSPAGLCLEEVRYPHPGPFPKHVNLETRSSAPKIYS